MPIRISGADVVLYTLCLTGHGIVHMAVKDFVQLKDVITGDRDNVEILMNDAQCVTISGGTSRSRGCGGVAFSSTSWRNARAL